MTRLTYAMQFVGRTGPEAAAAKASGARWTTEIGSEGLRCMIEPVAGESATFESTVEHLEPGWFLESGEITFGSSGDALVFETVGRGWVSPSIEPGWQTGAVIFGITGGRGHLEGASGYVCSNFLVGPDGELIDNHLGVVMLEDNPKE